MPDEVIGGRTMQCKGSGVKSARARLSWAEPMRLVQTSAAMSGANLGTTMTRKTIAYDLVWLFALALGFRLMWAVLIPPWMAPDEPAHFTYVAHLIELNEIPHEPPYEKKFPIYAREVTTSFTLTQFDALHRKAHPKGRFRPERSFLAVHYDYGAVRAYNAIPKLRRSAAGASATPYPPFYYWISGLGYRAFYHSPLMARLFAVRAVTSVLGALCACFAYLFAGTLRPDRGLARAVGSSVALLPMHTFLSGAVNNDTAVCLAATVLCWLSARAYTAEHVSPRLATALGAAGGVMMMMKPTGTALLPIAFLIVLLQTRRSGAPLRERVTPVAGFIAGLLLTFGAWTIYRIQSPTLSAPNQYSQEGDLISGLVGGQYSLGSYLVHLYDLGLDHLYRVLIVTFWGKFGWREWPLPDFIYAGALAAYGLSALGSWKLIRRDPRYRSQLLIATVLVMAQVLFIFLVADYGLSYRRTGKGLGVMGRYLFPAIAPLFFVVWTGVSGLSRTHAWPLRLVPLLMLLVQAIGLGTFLFRAYGIELG